MGAMRRRLYFHREKESVYKITDFPNRKKQTTTINSFFLQFQKFFFKNNFVRYDKDCVTFFSPGHDLEKKKSGMTGHLAL